MESNNSDPLSQLALKYLSDKCPEIKHPFTPYYFELLKDKRKSFKKVLEIGIGYREMALHWRYYRTGASLLMWRDFFPYAEAWARHFRVVVDADSNAQELSFKMQGVVGQREFKWTRPK
jgi:hypothetical protein